MPDRPDPIFELLQMGQHQMTGVWQYLFPEEFAWLKVPDERHATCDDCYKVKLGHYRDDCRCCTYFPELSNFLLGLALLSPSRDAVLPLVEQRYILPFGLVPTPLRYERSVAAYADDRFGEETWMVCPFVEPTTFHCRVYPFRNSVCSTFFCRNDHGKAGEAFWSKAQGLVGQVETAIAQWCMDEIGLAHEEYVRRLDALSAHVPALSEADTLAWSEHAYATLWDDWLGREVEFLESCARLVGTHRRELYDISLQQADRTALVYEERVRQAIPERYRHAAPQVAEENHPSRPIEFGWYKVQLSARQLWELPFQQGPVVLNDAAEIIDNPRDDEWCRKSPQPCMVCLGEPGGESFLRELFAKEEVELLRLFEQPQCFDEKLFARPEVRRLESPRELLAKCLRLGILSEAEP